MQLGTINVNNPKNYKSTIRFSNINHNSLHFDIVSKYMIEVIPCESSLSISKNCFKLEWRSKLGYVMMRFEVSHVVAKSRDYALPKIQIYCHCFWNEVFVWVRERTLDNVIVISSCLKISMVQTKPLPKQQKWAVINMTYL